MPTIRDVDYIRAPQRICIQTRRKTSCLHFVDFFFFLSRKISTFPHRPIVHKQTVSIFFLAFIRNFFCIFCTLFTHSCCRWIANYSRTEKWAGNTVNFPWFIFCFSNYLWSKSCNDCSNLDNVILILDTSLTYKNLLFNANIKNGNERNNYIECRKKYKKHIVITIKEIGAKCFTRST